MKLMRGRLRNTTYVRASVSGGGSGGDDYMASIISSLAADTWSGNVALNILLCCAERRKSQTSFAEYYTASGQATINAGATGEVPFSYGSGVYVPGWRLYMFTGGGHGDWIGSEVSKFDMTTGMWSRTDESAKYALNTIDSTVPFQSTDPLGYRAWRNPSGRFAPSATHMYGGMDYMSHNAQIYTHGGSSFGGGSGAVGGSTWIDVSSGHWNETGAYANAPGAGTDCQTHYLASCVVMTSVAGTATGVVHPGVWRVIENQDGYLVNVCALSHVGRVQYFGAAGDRTSHGTVIPDPQNPGWKAYVGHGNRQQSAIIMNQINMSLPTTAAHHNTVYYDYAVTLPTGVGHGTWIYMGAYVTGCEKIAVWNRGNPLMCLDISTSVWTWTTVIDGPTAVSAAAYGSHPANKRFFYMSDYQAFGVWDSDAEALYVLRKPAIFS
jgi:hypothetical protein